jgi:hypothetical protein
MPGVLEGEDLTVGASPGLILEDHVVISVRVERRVEVD